MWDYKVLEVVRVVDGDTVDLRVDLGFHLQATLRFRLYGIDTPERGMDGWSEATDYTRKWLADKKDLRIQTYKSDSFGRWLGVIYSDASAEQLSIALLSSGHAVEFRR